MTVFLIALFSWYLPMVIFTFFVFDILGVKKIYSLIPIYNVYKLLDEYQGRVWKKHWGVFYVILSILPILLYYIAPTIIIFLLYMLYPITLILSLPLTLFIFGLTLVIIYLPLLRNNFFKFILLLNLLLPIIWYMISISIYFMIALVIFFNYFYAFVAFDTWRKVKSGKYVVYEKLDYSKLSSSDIKAELASRGRVLIHSVDELKHNS